jgi:hypothetical protein
VIRRERWFVRLDDRKNAVGVGNAASEDRCGCVQCIFIKGDRVANHRGQGAGIVGLVFWVGVSIVGVVGCGGDGAALEGAGASSSRTGALSAGTRASDATLATSYEAHATAYRAAAAKERQLLSTDAQKTAGARGATPSTARVAAVAKREKLAALADKLAAKAQSAADLHARRASGDVGGRR